MVRVIIVGKEQYSLMSCTDCPINTTYKLLQITTVHWQVGKHVWTSPEHITEWEIITVTILSFKTISQVGICTNQPAELFCIAIQTYGHNKQNESLKFICMTILCVHVCTVCMDARYKYLLKTLQVVWYEEHQANLNSKQQLNELNS